MCPVFRAPAARTLGAAFSRLASLGAAGCSCEQPLEAARRALDPALGVNPGFLRSHAMLAVVFITNEDDCSVASPETFRFEDAPAFASIRRCFDLGVRCCCPGAEACDTDPAQIGDQCTLRGSGPLWPVSRYVRFFRALKRGPGGAPAPSRVVLAALAGDVTRVSTCLGSAGDARLRNTCVGTTSLAYPAFRLRAVVEALAAPPHLQPATTAIGTPRILDTFSDICQDDFRAALRQVGARISAGLSRNCPDV